MVIILVILLLVRLIITLLDLVKTLIWKYIDTDIDFFFPLKSTGKSVIFHLNYKHFSEACVSDVQKLLFKENNFSIIAFVHNNEAMNSHNLCLDSYCSHAKHFYILLAISTL